MDHHIRKLIALALLLLSSCGLMARGGHGGGHRGGGHHSGHQGGHMTRHAGHHGYHHTGSHHGYHHGYHGYHGIGRGYGWRPGWAWGYPGWRWGARAALVAGSFLFAGYTYDQWQRMAQKDPEKRYYFETVVLPAYNQYQQNPNSIVAADADGDITMTDQDDAMEVEVNIDTQGYTARPCCSYENGTWYVGGRDRTWWDEKYPGSWEKFGLDERSPLREPSFPDISEQPAISGFERSIYTSPK